MTEFILVRHGEPTYKELRDLGFKGHGFSLAPLTEKGIQEVKEISKNEVFVNSDILISSPYTRAIQTASIIANEYNMDINVEILLHEWICDNYNNYSTTEEFLYNIKKAKEEWLLSQNNADFIYSNNFESFENVRKRALSVLEKYCGYDKVIVVAHGVLISMLFNEKVRLHTGSFITTTSLELEKNFDFHPKTKALKKF